MTVFNIIFPIFFISLAGYLVARFQILSMSDVKGLSQFVFVIALPIYLFYSIAKVEIPTMINWKFFISYYLATFVIYFLGMLIQKASFSGTVKEQAVFGLGSSYSNLVLVGLPIISSGFGDKGILPLFMLVSIQSAVLFSLTILIIERGKQSEQNSGKKVFKQTLKGLAQNPIVVALLLGLFFNLANIPISQSLNRSLEIFSSAALPCALFVLGASLNDFKVKGEFVEAGTITVLKMILHPILVWVMAFSVFDLDPLWGNVAVLAAGMPTGINTYLFAYSYHAKTETISAAILLSSLFAILSQTILLSLFI